MGTNDHWKELDRQSNARAREQWHQEQMNRIRKQNSSGGGNNKGGCGSVILIGLPLLTIGVLTAFKIFFS